MCMMSSPKAPAPPAPPPPPPQAPRPVDDAVKTARADERNAARAAAGRSGTILTGSDLETTDPNTSKKVLLG